MKKISLFQTFKNLLSLTSLAVACVSVPLFAADVMEPREITTLPGAFDGADAHVQGICCDENAIYAVFNNFVYKLDWTGAVVKSVPAVSHSGDPCIANNRLYVAMSSPDGCAFYEYDLDLNLTQKIKIPECGATDGIVFLNGKFYSGGPSPSTPHLDNPLNVYDENFKFLAHHEINFGVPTNYGPQSIATCRGYIFIAYYVAGEAPKGSARSIWLDPETQEVVGTSTLNGSNGWYALPDSMQPDPENFTRLLVAKTAKVDGKTIARFGFFDFDGKTIKDVTIK